MKNIEFINAGAGSGKTHRLVTLLAGYLSGEGEKYKPGEVFLTTFTELAAAEFREKAREALLTAGMYEEASQLETAAIGTVHAVAYGFVKKYWYILGRGANENVMSESDKQFYINQSLASLAVDEEIHFFEEIFNEFGFSKTEDNKPVDNPGFWEDHLKLIIEKMEQYDIEDLKTSIDKSKALIDSIFNNNTLFDTDAAKKVLEEYISICGDKSRKSKIESVLKDKLKYAAITELAAVSPAAKETKMLPAIAEIISEAASAARSKKYGEILKSYIDKVFNLAVRWKDSFNEYKSINRLIDYNDMEQLFLKLLNDASVAEEIRSRYKLVLVDEFQDSSPVQVKIFDRLSELVAKSIWVGDPKQAIYGFRGSDSLLIKAITDIFIAGDSKNNLKSGEPLNRSFRSRRDLVQLSNDVFTRAFTDIKPGNVKLTSERNDSQEFGNTIPYALKHWHFCRDNQSGIPPKTDHYENLSQQVVKFFQGGISVYDKSSKKLRPLCPEDVAILCRTNAEVNEITDSLRAAGLKTAGLSKNTNFLETPEVKLFLALLNYAQNSINGLAKAEILHLCDSSNYSVRRIIKSRIDYLPLRDEALEKRTKSENPDEIIIPEWEEGNSLIKRIDEFIMQIRALPVPDLAESLFIRLDLKTIVSHWGNAGSRIHNLESVIKHAADYDQRCLQLGLGASLNNFIVYLNSLEAQEEKAEKVKGAVNVLTYHKAKGLEWHAVILESLDKDELDQDDLIRKSFFGVNDVVAKLPDGDNVYPERYILLLPWFTGRKKKVTADVFALITETSEFKNIELKTREESKRLMYVGVTRARDYLISTSFSEAPLKWLENIGCKEVIPSGCSSEKIDIWNTGCHAKFHSSARNPEFIAINAMFSDTSLVKPEASPVFNPRYISPSKVQDTPADTKVSIIKDFEHRIAVSAKKNSDGDSPTDDQIGTCLHCIFCIFSEGSEQNTELAKRILKNQLMQHVFPEPERIIRSAENLYGFLKLTYGAPIKIHKELPLQMLTSEGQIIRGSCDLVWETNNGVVIVDYKSFQGGISQITAPDNEHYAGIYAPQLRTYCKVLEATGKKVIAILIYYAVTGLIVKLDIQ